MFWNEVLTFGFPSVSLHRYLHSEFHQYTGRGEHNGGRIRCAQTKMGPTVESSPAQLWRRSAQKRNDRRTNACLATELRGQSQ